eukprot:Rhum_TRINITY_DN17218_c0_g1::Rhum_TRINITY_DN17218_c0_g1_i1::g.165526::m.165526
MSMNPFSHLAADLKYYWGCGFIARATMVGAAGMFVAGASIAYTLPTPKVFSNLTLSEPGYFRVDAQKHGMDGVRYRYEPVVGSTVAGLYPTNSTILKGWEAEQYPKWVLLQNNYWLPVEVDGKVCVTRLPPPTSATS